MPFLAEQQYDIPNKDILSWEFDDLHYNPDEPVSKTDILTSLRGPKTNRQIRS